MAKHIVESGDEVFVRLTGEGLPNGFSDVPLLTIEGRKVKVLSPFSSNMESLGIGTDSDGNGGLTIANDVLTARKFGVLADGTLRLHVVDGKIKVRHFDDGTVGTVYEIPVQ